MKFSTILTTTSFIVFCALTSVAIPAHSQEMSLLPPNPKPGYCYTRVLVPAKFETVTEKVLLQEASEKIELVQPKYEWTEQEVLVKEAHTKLQVIPATFKTVTERTLVKEATTKMSVVPAVYDTVKEKIIDKPARMVWKKGNGPIEKIDHSTGEIMCLIEEPATYKTISKKVLKTPATLRKVTIPAEYSTIKKTVIEQPETVKKMLIPAEYKTVKVKKLAAPAKELRIPIPAQYKMVTKKVKVSDEEMRWQPVLCETNINPGIITSIQRALSLKGYSPGKIDGVIGRDTMRAAERFQGDKGLAQGGLTLETINALGITL